MKGICLVDTSIFVQIVNVPSMSNDGRLRRACAAEFVKQVELAIDNKSPFTALNFLEAKDMRRWLAEFPDWAMRGSGLGDLTIVHDWERIRDQNQARRVYVWSLDEHLAAYDTGIR